MIIEIFKLTPINQKCILNDHDLHFQRLSDRENSNYNIIISQETLRLATYIVVAIARYVRRCQTSDRRERNADVDAIFIQHRLIP